MNMYRDEKLLNKKLKGEIESAKVLARDLGYRKEDIDRLDTARSFVHLQNLLKSARLNS